MARLTNKLLEPMEPGAQPNKHGGTSYEPTNKTARVNQFERHLSLNIDITTPAPSGRPSASTALLNITAPRAPRGDLLCGNLTGRLVVKVGCKWLRPPFQLAK